MSLTTKVLLGLVLGLAFGVFLAPAEAGWAAVTVAWIEPLGGLWVNAIRMTVIPLIVSLLISGIVSTETKTLANLGWKTVAWFLGMVAASTTLGGLTASTLLRWVGAQDVQIPEFASGGAQAAEVTLPPFRDWFVGLLPANPVGAAAEGAILPLVVCTVVFGLAATRIEPELKGTVIRGAKALSEMTMVVVGWILAAAPVGVFALTLGLAAQTGWSVVRAVVGFLIVVAILMVTATLACYPLVRIVAGLPMALFAKACAPAQAVGFSTRSSLASLPPMLEEAEHTLGLPTQVSGLVLPSAVSVLKFASPMSRIVGTFFVASLFGVELGGLEMASLAAGMGLLSFYSPGIPSGGLFVMAPLWAAYGLPMEGIGILIALDLIPDMFLTVANVTGDLAVAVVVAGRPAQGWSSAPGAGDTPTGD
jgi:Na+/H+-dicarboxylate symporter